MADERNKKSLCTIGIILKGRVFVLHQVIITYEAYNKLNKLTRNTCMQQPLATN